MFFKLILSLSLSFIAMSQDFTMEDFARELSNRQSRVEEFRFIKEAAKKLGIKNVYMFGGTAAAWAHYVRWDMRRELAIEDLQPHRFDYDYTNIFRANQDFDVVIDGNSKQAKNLERVIQEEFNYFSGTRRTWEVRLLSKRHGDKDSILGNDFQNQHTDSHSTGLIEMMDCQPKDIVKDVRDFKSTQPIFLKDAFEAKLHFYYSSKHKNTSRYLNGLNPEIFSVIRYFTKAVQYSLKMREEDISKIKEIINEFNPYQKVIWNSYIKNWLDKNAKKLVVNAINMEYAIDLITDAGLKKKLVALGRKQKIDGMSWWLNKEPLRAFKLGQGNGQKASEIFTKNADGKIIVAHETNSFEAFESITKSHDGRPNALISREGVAGEAAALGNGHYVKLGRYGARETGLTIRYILNPDARNNSDFTYANNFLVINNKNALEVIYEWSELGSVQYFKNLIYGVNYDHTDKGVIEKINRRMKRNPRKINIEDQKEIIEILSEHVKNSDRKTFKKNVIKEWFLLEESLNHPDFLDLIMNEKASKEKTVQSFIFDSILGNTIYNPKRYDHPRFKKFLEKVLSYEKYIHTAVPHDHNYALIEFMQWDLLDIVNSEQLPWLLQSYHQTEYLKYLSKQKRSYNKKIEARTQGKRLHEFISKIRVISKNFDAGKEGYLEAHLLKLWFSLDISNQYKDLSKAIIRNLRDGWTWTVYAIISESRFSEIWDEAFINEVFQSNNNSVIRWLPGLILSQKKWSKHNKLEHWVQLLLNQNNKEITQDVLKHIISKQPEKHYDYLYALSANHEYSKFLIENVFHIRGKYWSLHPETLWRAYVSSGKYYSSFNNKKAPWRIWGELFQQMSFFSSTKKKSYFKRTQKLLRFCHSQYLKE